MKTLRVTWDDGDDKMVAGLPLPLDPAVLCSGMTFESLNAGYTSYRQVSQFCFSTGDMNPIYLRDDAGRRLGFKGRILPGRFIGSLVEGAITSHQLFRDPILQSVQETYKKPVYPGEKLQLTLKVLHIQEARELGGFLITLGFWAYGEDGEIVIIGTHTFLVFK